MKITEVRVFVPKKRRARQAVKPKKSWLSESIIANPMSTYPEYFERRSSWYGMLERTVVQIETDEGITGLGETTGGQASASIIKHHLRRFLIGQSPFQVEKLWDMMYRSTLPYGRKGVPIMAISAVDLALWDLIAKARNEPLYQTLGGPVKDEVPAYVTGNEYEKTNGRGFLGQKLAMPYGPAHGQEGIEQNLELIADARQHLGDDVEIMLDCYMAWDVEYTIRMARLAEPYRLKWIEESLMPDDYKGYAKVNERITSTAIATGEHEYTRYGFQTLLDARGAEILQPDICWVGGITEARKISAMISAQHLTMIPHGGGLQPWALHFIFADTNIPMAEFAYVLGADQENESDIYTGVPVPKNGRFTLPEGIGAGIEWKETAMDVLDELE